MSHHPIHILHLTAQWLRWVKILSGPAPQLLETGQFEGAPAQTLEQWFGRVRDRRARVALYDARPIYYSFSLTMPTEALKQKEKILRLKMAQEVSLPEDGVFWSARTEPRHDNPAQSDVYMTVVRRDAMAEVVAWRDRRKLSHLWVGPDLCAIRALIDHAATPLVVLNMDPQGVTIYHANGQRRILKERADEYTPARPDLGWSGATGRLHFGGEVPGGLYDRYPTLGVLPRVPASQLQQGGAAPTLKAVPAKSLEADAVLLGGILEHATGHPPTDDLLRITKAPPVEALLSKFTLVRLAAIAVLLAAGLGSMGFRVYKDVSTLRENLGLQSQTIEPNIRQLQTQDLILKKVKSDRKPLRPVFEAIHKAVPNGVVLKTLAVSGESGSINMEGTCKSPEAPGEFAFGLSQSPLLDRIMAKDIKFDPRSKIVSFRITGHIKGRGIGR